MTTQEHFPIAAEMDTAWPPEALTFHGERIPFVAPIFGAFMSEALQSVNATGPIVEIGAGIGYLGEHVSESLRGAYVQTEIGQKNCLIASKRNADMTTIAARAQELPFESGSVGAVVARNLFDMVDTPAVVAEIGRVLRPGGQVLHMRDHRPSLVWIHGQLELGSSKRLIPHFDSKGNFNRLQVITAAKLAKVIDQHPIMSADMLSDPSVQEFMSGGAESSFQRDKLMTICRLASKDCQRVTDPITEIMNKKIEKWFKKLGFDAVSQTVTAGYELPKEYAVRRGWPADVNFSRTEGDSFWWQGYDPSLPDDRVDITHTFDVISAVKMHA